MDTKTCNKCGKTKAIGEFHFTGHTRKDGTRIRNGQCNKCRSSYRLEWYRANKEKCHEYTKKHYRKNYSNGRWRSQGWWIKIGRFGAALDSASRSAIKSGALPCVATIDEIESVFTGKCFCCGVPEQECSRLLALDHCHKTGKFRGWLCTKCNTALGMLNDSHELILKLAEYVSKPRSCSHNASNER